MRLCLRNVPSFRRICKHDYSYSSNIDIAMKSIIVHLQSHSVFDLVVLKSYVVLVDHVTLLQPDLLRTSADLR